jgi:hypothetical protein
MMGAWLRLKKGKTISFDYFHFLKNNKKFHILQTYKLGDEKHNKRSQQHQSKSLFFKDCT